MHRLTISGTIADAYVFVWNSRRDFLLLAFLPVLVLAVLTALLYAIFPTGSMVEVGEVAPAQVKFSTISAVLAAISLVLYVMFAVAWHRRFLVAGETTTVSAALRWGDRQTRFLLRLIGLVVIGVLVATAGALLVFLPIAVLAGTALGGLEAVVAFCVMLAAMVVYSRLLPVLPAVTVDAPLTFRASWRLTRGCSPQMVLIGILPVLPVAIAGVVAGMLYGLLARNVGLMPSITGVFLGALIDQVCNYVGVAATVSALSIAYRDLTAAGSPTTT